MNMKDFFAGVLTGIAASIVVNEIIDNVNKNVAADTVLTTIKNAFKKEGPIDGSWVVMKTEPYKNNVIYMDVYRGGISRMKEGILEQFEFAADAKTGTIVELIKR